MYFSANDKPYRVTIVIVVDRPELRDASFMPVAPGTRTVWTERYATQGQAVRLFKEILRGAWDFASEYVAAVSVDRMQSVASPRTVRCRVERERTQTETIVQWRRRSLQVAAVRRCARVGLSTLVFPLVWRYPPVPRDELVEIDGIGIAMAA